MISAMASAFRRLFKGTSIQHWRVTELAYRMYVKRISATLPGTENYVTVPFRGHLIDIERGDITILPTLITGKYESDELDAYEASIASCQVVVDIGANVGIFSIIGAGKVGRDGRVIAIEPNPQTRDLLLSNLAKLDDSAARVTVVSEAIANYVGEAHWESTDYQGTGHLGEESDSAALESSMRVSVTTLDVLAQQLGLEAVPTFVKVDVEGFEPQVVEGGESFIRRHVPRILIEISGMNSINVGTNWSRATQILAETYGRGEYFGPLSEELRDVSPAIAIPRIVRDGRLHNALLT